MSQNPSHRHAPEGDLVLTAFEGVVGAANLLATVGDMARYLVDARGRYRGAALCVVRPANTAEVAATVAICARAGIAIVPQGGNTGMCGGATPGAQGRSVVISLERMRSIREVDPANSTITVDAGCPLAAVQEAASEIGKLFPLSLGSEGTCQIGGNIATNAGGTAVLRYGPMRDLVMGIEAVLPDGRIWNGLRGLRKDNTGYDLKHLFIGSEGTLGIVTGAVLKLFSQPAASAVALVALPDVGAALALLERIRCEFGERVTTFEVMSDSEYQLVLALRTELRSPLAGQAPWYAFIELTDAIEALDLRTALAETLGEVMEAGGINDATLAESGAQAENIWHIRHSVTEANLKAGAAVSHDTSVPVSRVPEFVAGVEDGIRTRFPDAKSYFVGHIGDGNIHAIAIFPREKFLDPQRFSEVAGEVNALVDEVTVSLGGSVSAEHGIGRSNRARLQRHKDPIELEFMRQIKRVFDPAGLMNPGILL
ncbi:FAD-binding oxidoreductase [Bosea rubneri]|uniref:FAD-binding oxidoreductase n=1 Tax=Bosea rubneri TaxID=3075434 RepID=A0ABU3SDL3_9HYPH|nr:FAD-binding oxidoreductase [Bosea sp. ZW T0_25]MDU0342875.1 FAD-binding oxidoreductase [Bosea sp. ZW T0_25]